MPKVGKTDVFEREYTQKFRAIAGRYGEFVFYERDRAARDIGLHLSRKNADGSEAMSTALCWFQLKGIQASSSNSPNAQAKIARIRLEVEHLKFWYLQPYPTFLALYIEALDQFFVLNLKAYVQRRWNKSILNLKEQRVTVDVEVASKLDDQAFQLILRQSQADDWKRILSTDDDTLRVAVTDANMIWHLGSAKARGVQHRIRYWQWQSKCRTQLWIEELVDGEWRTMREHWEIGLRLETLAARYPYLEFSSEDEDVDWSSGTEDADAHADAESCQGAEDSDGEDDADDEDWLMECDETAVRVPGIGIVRGVDVAGECYEYTLAVRLNPLGCKLLEQVLILIELGVIEIVPGRQEWVSIAPWEWRAV